MKNYFGTRMKYILNSRNRDFVIFSEQISHDREDGIFGTSAGFCNFYIEDEKVKIECFGESISLRKTSTPEDSEVLTRLFNSMERI